MNRRFLDTIARGVMLLTALLPLCGCSNFWPEMVPFGAVSSPDQYRSLNGLGVHRRMWESAGTRVLTPQKLSPRLESFDSIVLVGQTFDPPSQAARQWLEEWLGRKPGRSVIYFGRDFNANIHYRQQTLPLLDAADKSRGQDLLALARARELAEKLQTFPESTFCGWFFLDVKQTQAKHVAFRDTWSDELDGIAGEWPTTVLLQPPKRVYEQQKPSWLNKQAANPLKPASALSPNANTQLRRIPWTVTELDTDQAWDKAFEDLPAAEILLSASNGDPLIFRLTHPQRYPGSQLIVVANGGPLLNGSLVQPLHRRIGELLVEECLPSQRVALLAYSDAGLLISAAPEADPRGKGLELLTVWPLSGITVPALLVGLIICAMLLPILGRPQKLPKRSTNDFGLHVEALGELLHLSRDLDYAKRTISEYFQKVRGEPPPAWLEHLGKRVDPVAPRQADPKNPTPTTSTPPNVPPPTEIT